MRTTRSGRAMIGWAAAVALGALPAGAITRDWTRTTSSGGTYSYAVATNWSPSKVPVAADIARFNKGAAYTITFSGTSKISRVIIGNDNLIMDMHGGSYTATSSSSASLQMGIKAKDVARLQVKNGTLNTSQTVLGSAANSSGSVTVSTGGVWNGTGPLTLGSLGSGNLTVTGGGKVNASWLKLGTVAGAKGTVLISGTGSVLHIAGDGTIGSNTTTTSTTAGLGTFYVRSGAAATFDGILNVRKGGDTRVEGGTLTAASIQNVAGGKLTFTAGVINVQQSDFLVGTLGPLGTNVTLTAAQTLNVVHNTLLNANAVLIMQDGKLTSNTIDNHGEIRFNGLNSVVSASLINNSGLIRGRGQTAADIANTGEIRAVGSDNLTFTGATTSSGQINLQGGGTINFSKPLSTSGAVNVAGTLGVPAGVSNSGQINFTTGVATVAGALSNTSGGKVSITGTSTQFQSDVAHNGTSFSVAPSSVAFFAGDVTGAGDFTGGGLLEFLSTGSYNPGGSGNLAAAVRAAAATASASIGSVHMDNTVLFQSGSTLYLDLGPDQQADQITDTGDVQLAAVNIVVDPAFAPHAGDTYKLLLAGHIQYAGPITLTGAPSLPYEIIQTPTELAVTFTVPEPSVLAGVCLGSVLFMGRRRRSARIA